MFNIYFLRQLWVSTGVFFNIIGISMILAYSSCLLKGLEAPDSPISIDVSTASWLVSLMTLSWPLGLFLSSYLMEKTGRRNTHFILILPGVMGWILIYFATSISMLMCGRILGGFATGGTVSLGAVVIGEYTDPKWRGMLLNMKCCSACIGVTVLHILGHYFHWSTVALLSNIPFVLGLLITLTWPESPPYLAAKNRFHDCEKSFTYLRGHDTTAVNEFESMITAQKNRKQKTNSNLSSKIKSIATQFTEKDFLKPLCILVASFILEEACGRHLFAAYGPDIIHKLNSNNEAHDKANNDAKSYEFIYVLAIDLITIVSTSMASVLFVLFKRRTLLFFSGVASVLVLAVVCTYLFLVSLGVVTKVTLIPLSLFVLYYILINLGCSPIPFVLLGEIFPLNHRSLGTFVGSIVLPLSLMVALKVMPIMLASVDLHGTFFVFAVVMTLTLIYLYFSLPETKNRTLQEIGDYFQHGKFVSKEYNEAVEMMLK